MKKTLKIQAHTLHLGKNGLRIRLPLNCCSNNDHYNNVEILSGRDFTWFEKNILGRSYTISYLGEIDGDFYIYNTNILDGDDRPEDIACRLKGAYWIYINRSRNEANTLIFAKKPKGYV